MLEHESKEPFSSSMSDVKEAIDSSKQKMMDRVKGKGRFVSLYEAV